MLNFDKQPYSEYKKQLLKGLTPKERKNLLDANEYLGEKYLIRYIDGEPCIYRNLENGHEIEVSGIFRRNKVNGGCYSIYVWKTSPMKNIHRVHQIKGLQELKNRLDEVVEAYEECDCIALYGEHECDCF